MKGTLTLIILIALVGCAKSFHEVNKSYYHPIPDYWQVKTGEVIIERELDNMVGAELADFHRISYGSVLEDRWLLNAASLVAQEER